VARNDYVGRPAGRQAGSSTPELGDLPAILLHCAHAPVHVARLLPAPSQASSSKPIRNFDTTSRVKVRGTRRRYITYCWWRPSLAALPWCAPPASRGRYLFIFCHIGLPRAFVIAVQNAMDTRVSLSLDRDKSERLEPCGMLNVTLTVLPYRPNRRTNQQIILISAPLPTHTLSPATVFPEHTHRRGPIRSPFIGVVGRER
jgi:hypothetical protein